VKVVAPCEGTGYEIGSMSIIKGAKNMENAKKWYDWALTPEAQAIAGPAKAYQVPSNKAAPVPPQAPKLAEIKLINYDFAKYGTTAERTRLLTKWDKEVSTLPK
jgi:iron(III) transport system substrate-binding protein